MNPRVVQLLANVLVSVAVVGLALVSWGDAAYAQALHSGAHSGGASSFDIMGGIKHGIALAATVLLAGLALFAALVWLPASKESAPARTPSARSFLSRGWCSTCSR